VAKRILIVEDEVDLADMIVDYFKSFGWETLTAANGKVALAKIEGFQPDVILTDMTMPVMTGLELLEELDILRIEIPVIFLTGFSDVEKMKMAWEHCAFDYLEKPLNPKIMLQIADNAFDFGREYIRSARKRFMFVRRTG